MSSIETADGVTDRDKQLSPSPLAALDALLCRFVVRALVVVAPTADKFPPPDDDFSSTVFFFNLF